MRMNERIKSRRKELKLTQAAVASTVKVSRVSITQWELGDTSPKGSNLLQLSKVLKCSPEWILSGGSLVTNTMALDSTKPDIPLISWVQAGSFSDISDIFTPGFADEFYPCPEKHSPSTFALKVLGQSMSPEFAEGEIIFVDPYVEAHNGSCVVVRQNGDTEATFKQLIVDGSQKFLKALNPDWPTKIIEMLPDAHICGVVIGSYRKRT